MVGSHTESTQTCEPWRVTIAPVSPIHGYPPHLLKLSSGKVLLTHASRERPYSILARLWGEMRDLVLDDEIGSYDHGYPATVELEPGTLLSVYYESDISSHDSAIRQIRWRLEG